MTDVTDATFETDVLARSNDVPVVVDLWAPWCGPCRTLGPILEQVVEQTEGKVELVKINVDENPQSSAAFRVQSIPAVYALKGGAVVDGFIGAQGESEVRAFVERLLPSEAENELAALIAAGDEASLRRALELEPDNEPAIVALAELLVSDEQPDDALELLGRIPETAATRRVAALARAGRRGRRPRPRRADARRAPRSGQDRRRGPPGVRRPARAARPGRPSHGRLPAQAHRPALLAHGSRPTRDRSRVRL